MYQAFVSGKIHRLARCISAHIQHVHSNANSGTKEEDGKGGSETKTKGVQEPPWGEALRRHH